MDLFEYGASQSNETEAVERSGQLRSSSLLAERLRPQSLKDMLLPAELLRRLSSFADVCKIQLANRRTPPSLVVFGPPGCGKTSSLRAMARDLNLRSTVFLPTEDGARELKIFLDHSRREWMGGRGCRTVLIDEIHRLNRANQDILLAALEEGSLHLFASTTENPSYSLNPALISRVQVVELGPMSNRELHLVLDRAVQTYGQTSVSSVLSEDAVEVLIAHCGGDARRILNTLEVLMSSNTAFFPLTKDQLLERLGPTVSRFQAKGSDHYDLASALIKSIRGSDPNAALYYLARLCVAREQLEFISRRLIILASEDVGNADPRGLQIAVSAAEAARTVGWPEARIILSQAVIYLACAPKSNSAYTAITEAISEAERTLAAEVPLSLRSSRTSLSKSLGYGSGYQYSHQSERGYIAQRFLPKGISGGYLELKEIGFEKQLKRNLEWIGATRPSESEKPTNPTKKDDEPQG